MGTTFHQQNNGLSLGCGTLILIALIVIVFSGSRDIEGIQQDVASLRSEVGQLEQEVTSLNQKVDRLLVLMGEEPEAAEPEVSAPAEFEE